MAHLEEKGQSVLCKSHPDPLSTSADMKTEDEGGVTSPSNRSTEEFTWTEEEETAVRRKLDRVIVPLTTFLYLLCFLDRYVHNLMRDQHLLTYCSANVGNARIQGMAKDLNLVGYRFNWVTSIFYIVYMFVEVPSNILLKKIGPKWYLPMLVVGFGFVSLCTAFVHSFEGLLAARAILGVFEGGVMS